MNAVISGVIVQNSYNQQTDFSNLTIVEAGNSQVPLMLKGKVDVAEMERVVADATIRVGRSRKDGSLYLQVQALSIKRGE